MPSTSLLSVILGATALASAPIQALSPATCATTGERGPGDLHRAWILQGWEHHPGDPRFSFREKLGQYYDWSTRDVLLFDDFDPQRRAARSAAAYGAIWEPIFRANRSARHTVSDGPEVVTGTGDLAASSLEFTARIEPLKGEVVGIRTRSDIVWRCRADGWKIVREHNSSKVIPVAEAERVLARDGR